MSAAGFTGLEVGQSFDVAVPICAEALPPGSESRLDSGTEWWLVVMGRLKPGWTKERASAQLAAISPAVFESSLPSNYPRESVDSYLAFKLRALPASGGVSLLREQYSGSLFFLQATAGLVLLVGCANLASLMLARATARERELAARMTLGAGRGRLVQLLLCESLVLAGLGALGGAWLAGVLSNALVSAIDTQPSTLFLDLALDWRVFGFAAFVATTTCALFGLAPALRAARVSPESVMRLASRGTTEGRARLGLRRALVVAQVGLSLVLVAGAFLSARSLGNLLRQDAGLELDNVLIAYVDLSQLELSTDRRLSYRTELVERLRGVPGVVSVAETTVAPLTGSRWSHDVWREGGDSAQRTRARIARTSPDYFATMGVRLVEGRVFDARDTAQALNVTVVNQALARAVFGSASAVGQRFRRQATPRDPEQVFEVVGVVRGHEVPRAARGHAAHCLHGRFAGSPARQLHPAPDPHGRRAQGHGAHRSGGFPPGEPRDRRDVRGLPGPARSRARPRSPRSDALGILRPPGSDARDAWPLWRHGIRRRAAHGRDRHPDGPRRATDRDPSDGRCANRSC